MNQVLKLGGAVLALGLGALCVWFAIIFIRSETIIQRRYPLPSTLPHAEITPQTIARGRHLAMILGCADCHGPDLLGREVEMAPGVVIAAPNLRALPASFADKDIARAIRFGLKPNGTSVWMMPSSSYVFMREADVDDLIAYIRSLAKAGSASGEPVFDFDIRRLISRKRVKPAAFDIEELPNSLDLGARYEGGRYIARTSCAECHGLALDGTRDRTVPDLAIVSRYTPSEFFRLLYGGKAPGGRKTPVMARLASRRFRALADYEVVALYRYLHLRGVALPVTRTPS